MGVAYEPVITYGEVSSFFTSHVYFKETLKSSYSSSLPDLSRAARFRRKMC
jgi:hypothetical protein